MMHLRMRLFFGMLLARSSDDSTGSTTLGAIPVEDNDDDVLHEPQSESRFIKGVGNADTRRCALSRTYSSCVRGARTPLRMGCWKGLVLEECAL
jgi:hypothetical protein